MSVADDVLEDYYDRDGKPLTSWKAYLALYEPREGETRDEARARVKRVAADTIGDLWVSTVWMGLDHSWGSGPPLIFETMVFGDGPWGDWQDRYASEAEALAGHQRIVAAIRAGEDPS